MTGGKGRPSTAISSCNSVCMELSYNNYSHELITLGLHFVRQEHTIGWANFEFPPKLSRQILAIRLVYTWIVLFSNVPYTHSRKFSQSSHSDLQNDSQYPRPEFGVHVSHSILIFLRTLKIRWCNVLQLNIDKSKHLIIQINNKIENDKSILKLQQPV